MADLKETIIRGNLEVEKKISASNFYPVGSVFIVTDPNSNPKDILGFGNWELIDREFSSYQGSVNDALTAIHTTSGTSRFINPSVNCVRNGHSIRIRIGVKPNTPWEYHNDTALGIIDFKKLGVKHIGKDFYAHPGGYDLNHSVVLADLTSGLEELSYIDKGVSKTTLKGQGILRRKEIVRFAWTKGGQAGDSIKDGPVYWDFNITVPGSAMIPSFCNKFYWKRIS